MKISVCMASFNGSKYIESQISSILKQLKDSDELIISDDGSTDGTIELIELYKDNRIKLVHHIRNKIVRKKSYPHYLVSSNYENALKQVTGEVVFLADQDDIWVENKIAIMMPYFNKYSMVMSDCSVIDENDLIVSNSFFNKIDLPRGLVLNISRPLYHGCCMAFKRSILDIALPFPKKTILHDSWIGILSENSGEVKFIEDKLVMYRRHFNNSSFSEGQSKNSLLFRFSYRIIFFFHVIKRSFLFKIH
ncbi:MAG: glycosyltransferase involved in cell wall biosynthesis [Flavobacterium sp.]|jgi:glycosyltransferase involved in cell wall biosynthesis